MNRNDIIAAYVNTFIGFWHNMKQADRDFAWFWECCASQYSLEVLRIAARQLGAARVGRNAAELQTIMAKLWQ